MTTPSQSFSTCASDNVTLGWNLLWTMVVNKSTLLIWEQTLWMVKKAELTEKEMVEN